MVRDGTSSQAMTTAMTAQGRGGRNAHCCAREPKSKRTRRAPATHSSTRARRNTISLRSRPNSIPSGTSLRRKDRSRSVSRNSSITPNKERDQGPLTLTLRRRRQRLCEGRIGRVIIVVTTASRRREASIVNVRRTDGSGETWKIHRVTQRLDALNEVSRSRCKAPACQLNEEKAIKETIKPTTASDVVAVHARNTVTPVHVAHNSIGAGGLLPVQRSTSYSLIGGRKGPTGRRSTKGGVSGPAEDLRPVTEVEAGVKLLASRQCTGAGCRFTSR